MSGTDNISRFRLLSGDILIVVPGQYYSNNTSSNGIEIKGTHKRGGYVRNVAVRDCTFPRLLIHSVPYNDDGIPASEQPYFEDFRFERLHLTGQKQEHGTVESVAPIEIDGFTAPGHKIKNVLLSDCVLPPNAKLLLSRYDALTISNLHTEEAQATSRYSATL